MRQAIRKKLARNKATAVWFFAPGFIDNGKFSSDSMEKLTGIKFDVRMKAEKLKVVPVKGSPLFAGTKNILEMNYGPVPVPVSPGQKVHGTANRRPAVVEITRDGQRVFYSLLPPTHEMVRALAKMCNIHTYLDSPDIFNINSTHIMLHASTAGVKNIRLPGKYSIYDAATGKKVFSKVTSFSFPMKRYESRIFAIKKENGK